MTSTGCHMNNAHKYIAKCQAGVSIFARYKQNSEKHFANNMFRRQLAVLDYPTTDPDFDDRSQFSNIVLWLEDQKIRHYPIDGRTGLRQIGATTTNENEWLPAWEKAYEQYKLDVKMPDSLTTSLEEMSWLIGYAVRLEYLDHAESFADINAASIARQAAHTAQPTVHSDNPLDQLDQTSDAFRAGIAKLAAQLRIDDHPDPIVRLQASAHLVHQKLSAAALAEQPPSGMAFPVKEGPRCAFDDADVDQAAKILRLLQIHHVRELQTQINETIVAVQELTADPKTDSKLGKVGMK